MNSCPCLESLKKLVTTGKWENGGCECGKNLPLSHLVIAGIVGFVLSIVLGALFFRSKKD